MSTYLAALRCRNPMRKNPERCLMQMVSLEFDLDTHGKHAVRKVTRIDSSERRATLGPMNGRSSANREDRKLILKGKEVLTKPSYIIIGGKSRFISLLVFAVWNLLELYATTELMSGESSARKYQGRGGQVKMYLQSVTTGIYLIYYQAVNGHHDGIDSGLSTSTK